jgi:hypothetical protein
MELPLAFGNGAFRIKVCGSAPDPSGRTGSERLADIDGCLAPSGPDAGVGPREHLDIGAAVLGDPVDIRPLRRAQAGVVAAASVMIEKSAISLWARLEGGLLDLNHARIHDSRMSLGQAGDNTSPPFVRAPRWRTTPSTSR